MRAGLVHRVFLLSSLVLGTALAIGCTLDTEGQLTPDASLGGSGGSGGTTTDAGVDADNPDISIPDGGCIWPNKVCPPPPPPGGECVDFDDPRYGCAQDTCAPCDPGPNAQSGCLNSKCMVKGCNEGFFSCDGKPETGCETNIWSLENCGVGEEACGKPCAPARAQTATCNQGKCEIVQCEGGWADCNDNPDDGCETNLRTIEDCGACFKVCTVEQGSNPTCASGVCKPDVCPPGRADCDTNEQDCETDITTTSNCAACGLVCSGPNAATWACNDVGGVRTCEVVTCNPGWGNCDGDHTNGCERDLRSSVDHCGGCNAACSTNNTESRACSNSVCVPTCASGYWSCDENKPGATDNGCETPITTLSNCGGCGVPCSRANATATCATGICSIASCNAGYGSCDGLDPNGCETNTNTSATHCGGCAKTCSSANVPSPTCGNGVCNGACATGFADCNTNKLTDGCEIDTNTNASNCDGCGKVCSSSNIPSPTCSGGTCNGTCASGFSDCNGNKLTDGCETNTSTSISNCGACGTVCSSNHITASCSAGVCNGTCQANWADCNTNKQSDGCETSTTTTTDCGSCGNDCTESPPVHTTPTCSSNACTYPCASDWSDCTTAPGCETNKLSDPDHCGECDRACSDANIPNPTCANGICNGTCASGFADCNGNKLTDGCETNITTVTHCGSCTKNCTTTVPLHTTATGCNSGSCVYTCQSQWLDCDGLTNGCECPNIASAFGCADSLCKCKNAAGCTNGGNCNGEGLCVCSGNTCDPGEICVADDTCGYP